MVNTYRQAIETRAALNKLTTKNISIETLTKTLDLVDDLDEKIKDHQPVYTESFQKLMNDNGVELINGIYDWKEHPQQVEISNQATSLLDAEIPSIQTNVFDEAEVIGMTHGLSVGEVVAFRQVLRK